jgi:acyl carrier protein
VAITQDELITGIAEIIEEVTGIEPSEVTMEKSFVDDLDIDSLSMVEIAVQTRLPELVGTRIGKCVV